MITVDSNVVHYKELILAGANGSSPAQNAEALEMIASGRVPVADLITHRLPLDNVRDAIDAVTSGDAIKVVIKPPRSLGMTEETSHTFTVHDPIGLHARPVGQIVTLVRERGVSVTLRDSTGKEAFRPHLP